MTITGWIVASMFFTSLVSTGIVFLRVIVYLIEKITRENKRIIELQQSNHSQTLAQTNASIDMLSEAIREASRGTTNIFHAEAQQQNNARTKGPSMSDDAKKNEINVNAETIGSIGNIIPEQNNSGGTTINAGSVEHVETNTEKTTSFSEVLESLKAEFPEDRETFEEIQKNQTEPPQTLIERLKAILDKLKQSTTLRKITYNGWTAICEQWPIAKILSPIFEPQKD